MKNNSRTTRAAASVQRCNGPLLRGSDEEKTQSAIRGRGSRALDRSKNSRMRSASVR